MSEDCDCPDGGHDDGTGSCLCGGLLHTELADLRRRVAEPVSYEQVLEHLLQAHGEHLRTTTDPLSLGDFVTVNYVNPLYARAKARPKRIRFTY